MATANTVITNALKLVGVLDPIEAVSPEDAADALLCLQELIEGWAIERLMIHKVARTTFATVNATPTYTIGSGATINVVRPLFIDSAQYVAGSGSTATDIQLQILTDQEWQSVVSRATTSALPVYLYYDHGFTSSGYGTISVWPVPTQANTIALWLPTPIVGPTVLTTTLSYPPGYSKALRYNLAVEIGPLFGFPANSDVQRIAIESKASLKRANFRLVDAPVDAALTQARRYNILTDSV